MSSASDQPPTVDDPRLRQAVQEYLQELEAGRRPDRRSLAARFPDLEEAMGPYLDALEMVHLAAPLLHPSSDANPALAVVESLPAEPLGDFRIVREIGRGGMGVVYEAVQRSLGRRVALKVLPFAAALDGKQLQRFKNEAQAAAHLHHPNIVPVYAVGMERGVHFYAMQLIEGQNLAALIDGLQRREPNEPRRTLAPSPAGPDAVTGPTAGAELSTQRSERRAEFFRSGARLMVQAVEALEYAHGLGIVHRDVKPANLLLDGRGNLWVTDFGLAQIHADAGLTQSGDLVGTLRYMSPEQAGGQRALIDHRTDVYALGATLYELLTLRPIFDGTDRQALMRQILHEEPRPPRSIDRSIPPEVETIVLKALGKSPAERYGTAQELADDLKRFLDDRPIRARRPSLLEKAMKWARRHKTVVVSAVMVLLASLAGLAAATVLIARAYDGERDQRAKAEANFRQAREAVDQFVQISEEELADNPWLERPRQRLLEAAFAYYQNFIAQHREDPSIHLELQASRDKLKTILDELATLMGAGQYRLLQEAPVQNELDLTQDQREVIAAMEAKMRESLEESLLLAPDERQQQHLALARDQEVRIKNLLTPRQLQRFQEIALQLRGLLAFSNAEVAAALGFTPEQKKRIREIHEEARPMVPRFGLPLPLPSPPSFGGEGRGRVGPRFGPPGRGGPLSPEGPREHGRLARQKMLDVLTPEQKRKWEELTGKPFEGESRFGPPMVREMLP